MKFLAPKFWQRGMGLIGIMVAGTSLLIGLIGAMQLVRTQQKQRAAADRTRDVEAVFNEIRLILNDSTNCTSTFAGKSVDGGTVTSIKAGSGDNAKDRYKTIGSDSSATYGSMKIKIESFKLQKDGSSEDSMWLQIVFDRHSYPNKKDLIGKRFQLAVTKNAGKVESCHGWYEHRYSSLWGGSNSLIKPTSGNEYIEINVNPTVISANVAHLAKPPYVSVMGPVKSEAQNVTIDNMDNMLTPAIYGVCGEGFSYFETSTQVGDAIVSNTHSDCFGKALSAAGKIKIGAYAPQSSVVTPAVFEYFSAANRYYQDANTWYLQERYDYGLAYICAAYNAKLMIGETVLEYEVPSFTSEAFPAGLAGIGQKDYWLSIAMTPGVRSCTTPEPTMSPSPHPTQKPLVSNTVAPEQVAAYDHVPTPHGGGHGGPSGGGFECPEGYVSVPGNEDLSTNDFCVMQFEAKNVSQEPKSVWWFKPWTDISYHDANAFCQNLGSGYDLITNAEWMTIARNAEGVGANWDGGVVGTGKMAQGKIINTGCDGAMQFVTTDCATGNNSSFASRRTLVLSNGSVIWDLGGNVGEWVRLSLVKFQVPYSGQSTCGTTKYLGSQDCTKMCANAHDIKDIAETEGMVANDFKPSGATLTDSTNAIGKFASRLKEVWRYSLLEQNATTWWDPTYAIRGGYYCGGSTITNGIYALMIDTEIDPYDTHDSSIGFRCVYHPSAQVQLTTTPEYFMTQHERDTSTSKSETSTSVAQTATDKAKTGTYAAETSTYISKTNTHVSETNTHVAETETAACNTATANMGDLQSINDTKTAVAEAVEAVYSAQADQQTGTSAAMTSTHGAQYVDGYYMGGANTLCTKNCQSCQCYKASVGECNAQYFCGYSKPLGCNNSVPGLYCDGQAATNVCDCYSGVILDGVCIGSAQATATATTSATAEPYKFPLGYNMGKDLDICEDGCTTGKCHSWGPPDTLCTNHYICGQTTPTGCDSAVRGILCPGNDAGDACDCYSGYMRNGKCVTAEDYNLAVHADATETQAFKAHQTSTANVTVTFRARMTKTFANQHPDGYDMGTTRTNCSTDCRAGECHYKNENCTNHYFCGGAHPQAADCDNNVPGIWCTPTDSTNPCNCQSGVISDTNFCISKADAQLTADSRYPKGYYMGSSDSSCNPECKAKNCYKGNTGASTACSNKYYCGSGSKPSECDLSGNIPGLYCSGHDSEGDACKCFSGLTLPNGECISQAELDLTANAHNYPNGYYMDGGSGCSTDCAAGGCYSGTGSCSSKKYCGSASGANHPSGCDNIPGIYCSLTNPGSDNACLCYDGQMYKGVCISAAHLQMTHDAETATANYNASVTYQSNNCPADYVKINNSFCVMKWEAKKITEDGVDYPVSKAEHTPWTVTNPEYPKTYCLRENTRQAIYGRRYDLISNEEWMIIARKMEALSSNWVGSIGTGDFKGGHIHANATPPYENSLLQSLDGYAENFMTGTPGATQNPLYNRKLYIDATNFLWDFSGNVYEVIDWVKGGATIDKGPTTCTCNSDTDHIGKSIANLLDADVCNCGSAFSQDEVWPTKASAEKGHRYVGLVHITTNLGDSTSIKKTGMFRGGYWKHGTNGGIFFLGRKNIGGADMTNMVGFRCVYRLGAISSLP